MLFIDQVKRINKKGFTLLELVLVIALTGILTATAIPRFSGFNEAKLLRGSARELAGEIRFAQTLAISDDSRYLVEFVLDNGKYRLYKNRNGQLELLRTKELPKGLNFNSATFSKPASLGWPAATFTPSGTPSSGGTVILENKQGQQVELTVTPATGRVLVKE